MSNESLLTNARKYEKHRLLMEITLYTFTEL